MKRVLKAAPAPSTTPIEQMKSLQKNNETHNNIDHDTCVAKMPTNWRRRERNPRCIVTALFGQFDGVQRVDGTATAKKIGDGHKQHHRGNRSR